MHNGWIDEPDVVVLARQALDLLDPAFGLQVVPAAAYWPVRGGTPSWTVQPAVAGCEPIAILVPAAAQPVQVLAECVAGIARSAARSRTYPGPPFPACPGHDHPATVAVDGADVVFRCPDTDEDVTRVTPCVP